MEIPQQDQVLKPLFSRFKTAPSSSAFVELASALLARGHAAEALSIAEHGLMLVPENVEGRIERAAALLALGRPRVAYVELLRALAIQPGHPRTMRLLGRAFVDAGAPGRAAELLARRSAETEPTERPPPDPDAPNPGDRPAAEDLPALFSALTKDLGLGAAVLEADTRRVEVTQIMRKRGLPRPPRTERELERIDGPIVETTQPGRPPSLIEREPPPSASYAATKTPLGHADLGFVAHDEPLFQEHLPFAVRPVERVGRESSSPGATPPDRTGHPETYARAQPPNPGDMTLLPKDRTKSRAPRGRPSRRAPSRARVAATRATSLPRPPRVVFVDAAAASETPPSEVFATPRAPRRLVLAAIAVFIMILYLGTLAYLLADELRIWLSDLPSVPAKIFPP